MHLVQGFTPGWLKTLCETIRMPAEATGAVLAVLPQVNKPHIIALTGGLTEPETACDAWRALKQLLGEDEKGFKMLTVMLAAGCILRDKLAAQGLGEDVFADTMEAFARFVKETKARYGWYGFDRDFWTWRQTSGLLVRLGQFEFEKGAHEGPEFAGVKKGQPVLNVHVPGGARLDAAECREGLARARRLWGELPMVGESWLFAPALDELLGEGSRLRLFKAAFEIGPVEERDTSYIEWVFDNTTAPPEQWPEDTSLRRAMKAYVLAGGKIGSAWAKWKDDETT